MPTPTYRVPVRVARGTQAALTAGLSDLQEGELCYATDENILYVIEGGALTATVTDLTGVEIVNDITPQLGGDLDTNSFQIISTAAGNIQIAPDTTGVLELRGNAGNDAAIQLNCEANTHGVKIKSPPHSAAATYTLVLPEDTGATGQALTTDGSGILSWATPSTVGSVDDLSDVDTTTSPPTDGQALVWDNANSEWVPGDVSNVDLGTSSIDDLQDVDTSSVAPLDKQGLGWDTTSGTWKPMDVVADVSQLRTRDLVDVSASPPTDGDILVYSGGAGADLSSAILAMPLDGTAENLGQVDNFSLTGSVIPTSSLSAPAGASGGSLFFPAGSGRLEAPDNPAFDLGADSFTTEVWFEGSDAATNINDTVLIFGQRASSSSDNAAFWEITNRAIKFQFGLGSSNGTSHVIIQSPALAQIQNDTWHHVAVVREGVEFRMYFDGALVHTETNSEAIYDSGQPFMIGTVNNPAYSKSKTFNLKNLHLTKDVLYTGSSFTPPLELVGSDAYVPTSLSEALGGFQVDLSAESIDALSDVDTTTVSPTDGQALVWDNANSEWIPGSVAADIGSTSIDALSDVDTTTAAPTNDQVLAWNGTNWVPADAATGSDTGIPSVAGTYIDSDSAAATSQVLSAPTHAEGYLLVAVIMSRGSGGTLTPPTGFALHGTYLSSLDTGGSTQTLSVFTKTATASEPTSYTWTLANSARICGWIASVSSNALIETVLESYGNATTAAINTLSDRLNLTAATWLFSVTNGDETYSQSGDGVVEITDSPLEQGRISGGYTSTQTTVTSLHSEPSTDLSPNHGMINIVLKSIKSINSNDDVDTSSTPPTSGQVLAWNGTNWVPADAATGGGGGGGGSSAARLSESQTAASGIATFAGIGHSGTLVDVTSSLDAWVVLYDSAASRTADSGRAYATDPVPGSGVLAELYIAAAGTVLATPGTTYFNNDASVTEAIYAAVRDQAGADVDSTITITAYGNQTITSVSGGTFGSGL